MKKKLLALFLTLTMVFSAFASLAIFADEAVDAGYTYDEEADTYTIYTADGYIAAVDHINTNKNGDATITLGADIDLEGKDVPVICLDNTANGYFTGVFDGKGYTLSNIVINIPGTDRIGIIGQSTGGTVQNLTLANSSFTGKAYTSAFIGDARGGGTGDIVTFDNCHIIGCTISSTTNYAAGFITTNANKVYIKNSTVFDTEVYSKTGRAGILVNDRGSCTYISVENLVVGGNTVANGTNNAGLTGYVCGVKLRFTNIVSLVDTITATHQASIVPEDKYCDVIVTNAICVENPISTAATLGQSGYGDVILDNVSVISDADAVKVFAKSVGFSANYDRAALIIDGVVLDGDKDNEPDLDITTDAEAKAVWTAATVPGVDAAAAQAKIYEMFAENEAMLVAALKAMHEEYDICAYVEAAEEDYFVSAANCTTPAIYYTSCQFCGKASENTFEYGDVQHTYDGTYEITDEAHWAICALCGDKKQGEHVIGDWEITLEPTEESTGLEGRLCECGFQAEERVVPKLDHAHKYTQYTVSEENLKSAATCATKATYYMTCACGAKGEETFQIGELAEHVFETEISSDANNHFYACTVCDAQKDAVIHTFDQKVATAEYKASEAEGEANAQYYFSCVCGVAGQETFEACKLAAHVYDQEVATEAYLASAATCTAKATYYKSCACGEKGEDTFEYGDTLPHVYNQEVVNGSYISVKPTCTEKGTYFKSCACGAKGTETFVGGSLATHVYNQEVTTEEYLERAATCTSEARYYKSCECGAKGYTTFKAEGYAAHVFDREIATAAYLATEATCSAKATYYKSCVCGEKGEATFESGETIAHVFDQEVATDAYLASAATCEEEAKYYYSCECGAKGEETFEDGDTADHTYGEWTTVKQPTETAEGSKEKVCTACGDKITEKIAKLPATTVVEEEKGCGSAIGGVSIIIMIAAAGAVIARKKED